MFAGSIRKNLDPLDEYTDEEILIVLEKINLKNYIINLQLGLETDLSNIFFKYEDYLYFFIIIVLIFKMLDIINLFFLNNFNKKN